VTDYGSKICDVATEIKIKYIDNDSFWKEIKMWHSEEFNFF
jgi:hypothetical protein